jgi:hypothetical protein
MSTSRRLLIRRPYPLAFVLLSASFAAAPVAASPQQPAQTQTVIDFTAIGRDGQPVLDLSSKEITLKVGGRQRDVKFFQLLRADGGLPAPAVPALPPPFATNIRTETLGRDVLIVIDEESIAAGKQRVAQDAVRDFVTSLGTTDRGALLSTRHGGRTELIAPTAPVASMRKRVRPDDMLRVSDTYRELPLQAAAFPSRTEDGRIRLVVVLESSDTTAKISGAAVGLYDQKGRLTRYARVAYGGFAIDKLPPGDVVMRAIVTVDGKLVGRAVRTL